MRYERITIEPGKMGGAPCIRGLRFPVATVVALVADGMSQKEILEEYPDLEPGDIEEALHYAAETVRELAFVGLGRSTSGRRATEDEEMLAEEFGHWKAWDRQLQRDVNAGKLDQLAEEALEDHRSGRTKPL